MDKLLSVGLCVLVVLTSLHTTARSKDTRDRFADYKVTSLPHTPIPAGLDGSTYGVAAANTTVLGWWQFDDPIAGACDQQGWTSVDMTAQLETYFHVDGDDPLDSGCHAITPVNGNKSMWCGQPEATDDPWCRWATLPGYGNNWHQRLVSDTLFCDTLTWSWTIEWDSEPGYDFAYVEYFDPSVNDWHQLPVNGGAGYYDGGGGPLGENFKITPTNGWTVLRYRFTSDGLWSDEDGDWPTTEGGVKLDDIAVNCAGGPAYFHDFEIEACGDRQTVDGFWRGEALPGFGDYAHLLNGLEAVQEDPCFRAQSCVWGFFDDPGNSNYECGGWPLQGALPYGPDEYGRYLDNEIWSPWIPNAGTGAEYNLSFLTYRDLPVHYYQFYVWSVRTREDGGCPSPWQSYGLIYYGNGVDKDWFRSSFQIGSFIPATATEIQVSIGAVDMYGSLCCVWGHFYCNSHAPLFDQVRLLRVDTYGPQWVVRHIDLWQDNFPDEGGVDPVTSFARCDMATDILPSENGAILPGDSLVVTVTDPNGLADDNTVGRPGKAVYSFVRVTDRNGVAKVGKNGIAIQSPDNRAWATDPNAGTLRWPWVGTVTVNGVVWDQFKMDFVYTPTGELVADRYCCDLMDIGSGPTGPHYNHANENTAANTGAFTPGDVINYFFGAMSASGQWTYWYRTFRGRGQNRTTNTIDEAALGACEWSVLPDAGLLVGEQGDILFVDDADDRVIADDRRVMGGPPQVYFDWAFEANGISGRVDRFDILGPSSHVGNSLASRVKSCQSQIIGDATEIYQQILWNTSNLSQGLIGDGGQANGGSGPDKSLDWTALKFFMDSHPDNPGLLLSGDDLANDWIMLTHTDAVEFRSTYMNFMRLRNDHVLYGEPLSPLITAGVPGSYGIFDQPGHPPNGHLQFYVYSGCQGINDFDVLRATGQSRAEMIYPVSGDAAVLAQATPTAQATARCVLTGFGFDFIRDDGADSYSMRRENFMRDVLIWFDNIIPTPTDVDPVAFENRLENAYPNPFNPTTTIKYSIREPGHVSLKIFNVAGQLVRALVDETQTPCEGGLSVKWNGTNDAGGSVSSGVYFYKLTTKGFTQTKKMVLLK